MDRNTRGTLNYMAALDSVGVEVHRGEFQSVSRFCNRHERMCPFQEEKRTDVGIAVKMLCDAFDGTERFLLVTADADQVPTLEAIAGKYRDRNITLIAPPGRLAIARKLGSVATEYRELTEGRMAANLFARNVYRPNGSFVAAMPASYIQSTQVA
jgi:NYN domain